MLYYFSNIRLTKEYNVYGFKAKKVTLALDYYYIMQCVPYLCPKPSLP